MVREVTFPEHARLAALETMIDFTAGTDASALHWSINEYDAMALTRGDMQMPNPSFFHNPGWLWSDLMDKIRSMTMEELGQVSRETPYRRDHTGSRRKACL